jgi:hypothetical protein
VNAIGPILGIAALLGLLRCLGPTAISGLLTGSLLYEPHRPPIRFSQRPGAFVLLLACYGAALLWLVIALVRVTRMLLQV